MYYNDNVAIKRKKKKTLPRLTSLQLYTTFKHYTMVGISI